MTRSPEPGATERNPDVAKSLEIGFERGLVLSRLLILIPVIVLVLSAAVSFLYDTAIFIHLIADVISHPFPLGKRMGELLTVIDLFLVGATFLIAGIGFYELFISRVDAGGSRRGVPEWLVMNDLNDLKARVVSMLVLVTAVSFVNFAVDFQAGPGILFLGAADALVIVALTAFLRFGAGGREGS